MLTLDNDSVVRQTIQNLVEAGILEQSECPNYEIYLRRLDLKDLLAVLIESHELWTNAPKPIMFYPIDMKSISMN